MQTYTADGDWRYAARTVTDRCLDTSVLSACCPSTPAHGYCETKRIIESRVEPTD